MTKKVADAIQEHLLEMNDEQIKNFRNGFNPDDLGFDEEDDNIAEGVDD